MFSEPEILPPIPFIVKPGPPSLNLDDVCRRLAGNDPTFKSLALREFYKDWEEKLVFSRPQVVRLAEALSRNIYLKCFVMDDLIAVEDAHLILEALTVHPNLRNLFVTPTGYSKNPNIILPATINFILHNQSVRYLSLHLHTDLNDAAIEKITGAIIKNPRILVLDLGGNRISPVGAKAIGAMLVQHPALLNLRLSGNNIGNAGALALAQALRHNTTLDDLNVDNNYLSFTGKQALLDAMQQHPRLSGLDYDTEKHFWGKDLERDAYFHRADYKQLYQQLMSIMKSRSEKAHEAKALISQAYEPELLPGAYWRLGQLAEQNATAEGRQEAIQYYLQAYQQYKTQPLEFGNFPHLYYPVPTALSGTGAGRQCGVYIGRYAARYAEFALHASWQALLQPEACAVWQAAYEKRSLGFWLAFFIQEVERNQATHLIVDADLTQADWEAILLFLPRSGLRYVLVYQRGKTAPFYSDLPRSVQKGEWIGKIIFYLANNRLQAVQKNTGIDLRQLPLARLAEPFLQQFFSQLRESCHALKQAILLDWRQSEIDDAFCERLVKELSAVSIHYLNLAHNRITYKGTLELVTKLPYLSALNLSANWLQCDAQQLFTLYERVKAKQPSMLFKLALSGNYCLEACDVLPCYFDWQETDLERLTIQSSLPYLDTATVSSSTSSLSHRAIALRPTSEQLASVSERIMIEPKRFSSLELPRRKYDVKEAAPIHSLLLPDVTFTAEEDVVVGLLIRKINPPFGEQILCVESLRKTQQLILKQYHLTGESIKENTPLVAEIAEKISNEQDYIFQAWKINRQQFADLQQIVAQDAVKPPRANWAQQALIRIGLQNIFLTIPPLQRHSV